MSTAESSFDEEIPASEMELMSDVNADEIATLVANYDEKPMSRKKMQLFLNLLKMEEGSKSVSGGIVHIYYRIIC